jgi:hypothetical protein
VDQGIHALPGRGRHQGRLPEHQREDLVGGRDLGQVDVGLQAGLLDLGDLLGRQGVVEVVGDGVGLEGVGAGGRRRGQAAAARHLLDAGDQFLGGVALGDLLADELGLGRVEHVVEVGEQGSQGQAHGGLLPGVGGRCLCN